MAAHLTMEQRQLARRLSAKGLSLREIGHQVGCSHQVIRTVVRRESKYPVPSDAWRPRPGRLTLADREEISLGLRGGLSFTEIAVRLDRATSTVSREVAGNGGAVTTGPGERISGPGNGPDDPSRSSCPAPHWRPRSPSGCRNGGRRRRSRTACGWTSPTIR